ncbi:hypothetical protein CEXT_262431 [Caerostris extrusa]|uniref:Uncharacterized protein n=1 Tax=Caerostris extrusa TaxID=172846 RepID=A0AAV4P455_CAEEX|nr:hypothetical protein CEXT_262431 [Caerostris extrusa]
MGAGWPSDWYTSSNSSNSNVALRRIIHHQESDLLWRLGLISPEAYKITTGTRNNFVMKIIMVTLCTIPGQKNCSGTRGRIAVAVLNRAIRLCSHQEMDLKWVPFHANSCGRMKLAVKLLKSSADISSMILLTLKNFFP